MMSVKFKKPFIKWRYTFVSSLIFCGLASLVAQTYSLQLSEKSTLLTKEADKRHLRKEQAFAYRGSILDRNGEILSTSVPAYSISINPSEFNLEDLNKLSFLGDIKELKSKIAQSNSHFLFIARQIDSKTIKHIKRLNIKGLNYKQESRRFYAHGEENAPLIGYTNIDDVGIEGAEKSFNYILTGKNGEATYRKDGNGKVIENLSSVKKYEPQDVFLSIDQRLQTEVYKEIKKAVAKNHAKSGTAIVADVDTGEILAMATAPSYNPNTDFDIKDVMRNKAITDTFEPGSTVKPFVVLNALQHHAVKRDEVINTGNLILNGHAIHDVAPREKQTLDEILENSSNRGVSRLALRTPASYLMNTYLKAGLGQPTNIGLIGEQNGYLNQDRKWSDIDRASASYGYGITTTPLQLIRAYMTLGNYGVVKPLTITKVDPPVLGRMVFSETITKEVLYMLEKVAQKNKRAMVKNYRVGIKTGTAKKLENGKYVNKYLAYTIGLAPISKPKYAVFVLIDEPSNGDYYGGAVSAPLFSNIMEKALKFNNIAPDDPVYLEQMVKTSKVIYLNKSTSSK